MTSLDQCPAGTTLSAGSASSRSSAAARCRPTQLATVHSEPTRHGPIEEWAGHGRSAEHSDDHNHSSAQRRLPWPQEWCSAYRSRRTCYQSSRSRVAPAYASAAPLAPVDVLPRYTLLYATDPQTPGFSRSVPVIDRPCTESHPTPSPARPVPSVLRAQQSSQALLQRRRTPQRTLEQYRCLCLRRNGRASLDRAR